MVEGGLKGGKECRGFLSEVLTDLVDKRLEGVEVGIADDDFLIVVII